MTTWLAVFGVAGGSFVLRFGPLLLGPGAVASTRVRDTLEFAGTAALASLIMSGVLTQTGSGDLRNLVPVVAAVGVAGVVAWRHHSMFLVLLTGLAANRLALIVLATWA